MRISRHTMFMEMAKVIARRGTCPRLCVGAIVVVDHQQIYIGYNGSPAGEPHCTDEGCILNSSIGSCIRAKHAEFNALRRMSIPDREKHTILYITHSPCINCAQDIVNSKINEVYFETTYRSTAPISFLMENGIKVSRLLPNGSIIDEKGKLLDSK